MIADHIFRVPMGDCYGPGFCVALPLSLPLLLPLHTVAVAGTVAITVAVAMAVAVAVALAMAFIAGPAAVAVTVAVAAAVVVARTCDHAVPIVLAVSVARVGVDVVLVVFVAFTVCRRNA